MAKVPDTSLHQTDGSLSPSPIVAEKPERKWQGYLWDTLNKSTEERRFLFKLDAGILTICCLGYFIKYLDQTNLNSAFVSGMKEDLNMYGNELNYVTTLWTVGYVIGQVPGNLLLTRVRPSIYLPCCEIIWSVLTMCLSRCTNVRQLYALRFFVGLAESGYYPGVMYMMGSWYRKDELGKRAVIFNVSSAIATMFSGYLMTAVITLDGRNGFKGWQWLYIMDGVISLPIALAGFFMIPDHPHNSRVWYISDSDRAIAAKRMELEERQKPQPYTKARVAKILSSWHIYLLPLIFFLAGAAGGGGQPIFAMFLKNSKSPKYTIAQINTYPTITSAIQIVFCLTYAWVSDTVLKGARWPIIMFAATLNVIIHTSLAIWNIPEGWRWACYMLSMQGVIVSPFTLVWANEICSHDNEERALVVGVSNDFAQVMVAWLPLLVWQQIDAPRYHKGFRTSACASAAGIVLIAVVRTLAARERKRRRATTVTEVIEAEEK